MKFREAVDKAKEIPEQLKRVSTAVVFALILSVGAMILGIVAMVRRGN